MRAATLAAVVVLAAVMLVGCASVSGEAPQCRADQRLALVAQSVPTASYVPCVASMPAGWRSRDFRAESGEATFQLASDRVEPSRRGRAPGVLPDRARDTDCAASRRRTDVRAPGLHRSAVRGHPVRRLSRRVCDVPVRLPARRAHPAHGGLPGFHRPVLAPRTATAARAGHRRTLAVSRDDSRTRGSILVGRSDVISTASRRYISVTTSGATSTLGCRLPSPSRTRSSAGQVAVPGRGPRQWNPSDPARSVNGGLGDRDRGRCSRCRVVPAPRCSSRTRTGASPLSSRRVGTA